MKGDQEVVWPNSGLPGWAALAGKKTPVKVGECHASLPEVRQSRHCRHMNGCQMGLEHNTKNKDQIPYCAKPKANLCSQTGHGISGLQRGPYEGEGVCSDERC